MNQTKKQNWFSCLLGYASGSKGQLLGSTCLSVISVVSGFLPYFFVYWILEQFISGTATIPSIVFWCGISLAAYVVKVVFFGLSTGLSHYKGRPC